MKDNEPIFLPIHSGNGGVNIAHIKRWTYQDGTLEVTVAEVNGQVTHMIHGADAERSLSILQERTA